MEYSYVTWHLGNHKKHREIKFCNEPPLLKLPTSYEGAWLSTQTFPKHPSKKHSLSK